jgi:hypothetical protein
MPRIGQLGIVPEARIEPPAYLAAPARQVFIDMVMAVKPNHFQPADVPTLANYCCAVVAANDAASVIQEDIRAATPEVMKAWSVSIQIMCRLALTLKVCPQARRHPRDFKPSGAKPSYYERQSEEHQ